MASISRRSDQFRVGARGFTYVGLLLVVALAGVALAGAGTLWSTATHRDREAELLFVGEQIQRAITSYYDQGPAGVKQFPAKLEDLLQDRRFPTTRRHLRKVFVDPVTGMREWGIVRGPGGGITGVFSLSEASPIKRAEFPPAFQQFASAKTYRDWRFVYGQAGATPGAAAGGVKPPASPPGAPGTPSSAAGKSATDPVTTRTETTAPATTQRLTCGLQQLMDMQRCNALSSPGTDASQKCIDTANRRFEVCSQQETERGGTSR
ncbi:MAG: hypothetical protein ACKVQT_37095 [Burkholderiales bacterium]